MLRALERTVDALGSVGPELNGVVAQIRDLVPGLVKDLGIVNVAIYNLATGGFATNTMQKQVREWYSVERSMRDAVNRLAGGWWSSAVALSAADVACLQGAVTTITDTAILDGGIKHVQAVLDALRTVISKNTHGV